MSSASKSTALKRSRTTLFGIYRDEIHRLSIHLSDSDECHESLLLDAPDSNIIPLDRLVRAKNKSIRTHNIIDPPDWLKCVKPIEASLRRIENDMLSLARKLDQGDSFGSSRREEEEALTSRTHQITQAFKNAKTDVMDIGDGVQMNAQEEYMRDNIKSLLTSKLQEQANKFRQIQIRYQRSSGTKRIINPNTHSFGVGVDDDDDEDEENNIHEYDIGFSQEQQGQIEIDRIRIEQRERQINQIAQQVGEVADMFDDISQMIHDQGSILDRIDFNIDNADHSFTQANKQLKTAVQGERGFSKCLCCLLFSVITFGTIVIVLLILK